MLAAAAACEANPSAKINPQSQTVAEGTWVEGVRTPSVVDLNGSPSKGDTYTWTQIAGSTVTLTRKQADKPDQVTFLTPDVPVGGETLRFRLTVTGCDGKSSTDEAIVNVTNAKQNRAPVAVVLATAPPIYEGMSFTLDGTSSYDPDGDTLTYRWEQLVNGSYVLVSTTAALQLIAPTHNVPNGVALTYRLTVSDGSLTGFQDQLVNVVWVNEAPIAVAVCTPRAVDERGSILLDASGSSDVDDGIRSYEWKQLEGGPAVNLDEAALTLRAFDFDAPALKYGSSDVMLFSVTVKDNGGLASAASCSVTILDVTPPSISARAVTAEATSGQGANVSFDVVATDAFDGDEPATFVSCDHASGALFPLGTTTVQCSAHDVANNVASTSFVVTVVDTTPPTFTSTQGTVTVEASGPDGAEASWPLPTATDTVSSATVTCAPASGTQFALGTTKVTCTAKDAANNVNTQEFNVDVEDTTAPTFTSTQGTVTIEATGPNGATATWPLPTATDTVSSVTVTCAPQAGTHFAIGTTKVTCTARDASNNSATQQFDVVVQDTTPPEFTSTQATVTVEATGPNGATASWPLPTATDTVSSVTVTCAPQAGTQFALGTTKVTCTAKDASNNAATQQFDVVVQDTTPPEFTSTQATVTVEATGPNGATATWPLPTATDTVSSVTVTCAPQAGTQFAIGTTKVTCTAKDASNNAATQQFDVVVHDTTPPEFTSTQATVTVEATGPNGATASWPLPTATDTVSSVTVTCAPASGTVFALGTTKVTCTAKDASNNAATQQFDVVVHDTTPPAFTSTQATVTVEATGPNGATATWPLPNATDTVSSVTVTCAPQAGSQFALGTTKVTCTAKDAANNVNTQEFNVVVEDTTAPTFTSTQGPVTIEATGPNGATATWPLPTATDTVSSVTVTCAPTAGAQFALGTTEVTCTAKDAANNSTAQRFNVVVQDTTAPSISGAQDRTVDATSAAGASVSFAPQAKDVVDGGVPVTCTPSAGSTFPIGVTAVSCWAADSRGNRAEASFSVTVNPFFVGFYQPIDNTPVVNSVKGGSTVPVKWSLVGEGNTLISDTGVVKRVAATPVSCNALAGIAAEVELTTTGGTVLRYDSVAKQFVLNWQTPKTPGACYQLVVEFVYGGMTRSANFKLK